VALRRLFGKAGKPETPAPAAPTGRLDRHRATFTSTRGDLPMVGHGQSASYSGEVFYVMESWRTNEIPRLPEDVAASWAVALVECLAKQDGWWTAMTLLPALSRRKLPLDIDDVALMLDLANRTDPRDGLLDGLKAAVAAAERLEQSEWVTLEPQFRLALQNLDQDQDQPSDPARIRVKLRRLMASASPGGRLTVDVSPVNSSDGWGPFAIRRLDAVRDHAGPVSDLVAHAASATSGPRPTKSWEKRMGEILASAPPAPALLDDLLNGVLTCAPATVHSVGFDYQERVGPDNGDLVRGLIWAARISEPPWLVPRLGAIASDRMAGDSKLANACFAALGRTGTPEAIAALIQLQRATRDRGNLKQIASALGAAAGTAGISASELVETVVPDAGLDREGRRRVSLGDVVATIALEDGGKVTLTYQRDGAPSARPPKETADQFASEIAALKRDVAELRKLVATERARLEDLLVEDRSWDLDTWRTRYLDHPVTGRLAGRMLWRVTSDGRESAVLGASAPTASPGATLRTWHPVHASADEVRKWREHLMAYEVTQPFKQAFREIYLLTPAEQRTRTYSNRFAAHVLDYQQLYALTKERRWATNYLGPWDGGYEGEAKRDFPSSGLRASFLHEPVETDNDAFRVEFCTTDQVRFSRLGDRSNELVPLADVPPAVFSEAMRDVDLFVGVASIAADPTWADRGEDRHYAYWEQTAFGELTATAETRKDVLQRLLPKLKIAARAHIAGNYLVVEGHRHTYKIHLGSANILMSPNDRYLCIVPERTAAPKGVRFVPFDGDRILTVILSKAFLLAADDKITDESILPQL
jgi:hypothetical protein